MKITKAITNHNIVSSMALALKNLHIRFYILWQLGTKTGLRISDLLTLRAASLKGNVLDIKEQKTGNQRRIKLDPDVMTDVNFFVKVYSLRANDFLIFSHENRKHVPMSRQWAHRIIARTASKKGLEFIGAHSMRKIYACNLFAVTGSLKCVQSDLGHKHVSTTLIYLKDLLESQFVAG